MSIIVGEVKLSFKFSDCSRIKTSSLFPCQLKALSIGARPADVLQSSKAAWQNETERPMQFRLTNISAERANWIISCEGIHGTDRASSWFSPLMSDGILADILICVDGCKILNLLNNSDTQICRDRIIDILGSARTKDYISLAILNNIYLADESKSTYESIIASLFSQDV